MSRFDGKKFVSYRTEDGLSDNDVLRITEDKTGRVWFLTFNGHLSYFSLHDKKIHNETSDPFLTGAFNGSGLVNALVDHRNRVWFCSLTGKVCMLDSNKITQINLSPAETLGEVCVSEDPEWNYQMILND